MKYKVILYNSGSASAVEEAGNFSFYVKSQAIAFIEAWRELSNSYGGLLWDGSTWTIYSPI